MKWTDERRKEMLSRVGGRIRGGYVVVVESEDVHDMLAELDRLKAQLGRALAAVDAEPLGKADRWGRDAVYEAKQNIKARIKGVMGGGT